MVAAWGSVGAVGTAYACCKQALPRLLAFAATGNRATLPVLAQVFLLLACFVAVPWMLLPKPLILKKRHEARLAQVGLVLRCLTCWARR